MHNRPGANHATRSNIRHDDCRLADPAIRTDMRPTRVSGRERRQCSVRQTLMLVTSIEYSDPGAD
jgi:hypothetical protein